MGASVSLPDVVGFCELFNVASFVGCQLATLFAIARVRELETTLRRQVTLASQAGCREVAEGA